MTATCAPHVDCSPDSCFTAKMRYWRTHGVGVAVPKGWGDGPTIREQVADMMDRAEANGTKEHLQYNGRAELI